MLETYRKRKREEARDAEVVTLRCESDAMRSMLGAEVGEFAGDNYPVGSYVVAGGTLCRVTRAISRGEKVVLGINVTPTSVADELAAASGEEG